MLLSTNINVIFICSFMWRIGESKLLLVHLIFRHGEKTPDGFLMLPNDPYKNHTFYPYGSGELTNEGKRTMYELGKTIRHRYNDFLGDIYTPDILDGWASSNGRCHTSLQLVLATLFPPKDILIWKEGVNWQPIPYKSLPRQQDDMFASILMDDYRRLYENYFFNGACKDIVTEIQPILSYVQEHTNVTMRTLRDLYFLQIVLLGEHLYGLKLPEWTKTIYPQPLNDLALKEYHVQLGTKQMKRKIIGRWFKKILDDSLHRVRNKTNYKLQLYSVHDLNLAYVFIFLNIAYSHAGFGACLALELHDENGTHFLEAHYRHDKHSKFKLLHSSNGERRLHLQQFESMVNEMYTVDLEETKCNSSSSTLKKQTAYLTIVGYTFVLLLRRF